MRFISWNVNGLRAVQKKGFEDIVCELDADIVALQETKLQEGQATLDLPQYREYWSYAEKKGYSGTAVFTKEQPLQVPVSYTHLDVYKRQLHPRARGPPVAACARCPRCARGVLRIRRTSLPPWRSNAVLRRCRRPLHSTGNARPASARRTSRRRRTAHMIQFNTLACSNPCRGGSAGLSTDICMEGTRRRAAVPADLPAIRVILGASRTERIAHGLAVRRRARRQRRVHVGFEARVPSSLSLIHI